MLAHSLWGDDLNSMYCNKSKGRLTSTLDPRLSFLQKIVINFHVSYHGGGSLINGFMAFFKACLQTAGWILA